MLSALLYTVFMNRQNRIGGVAMKEKKPRRLPPAFARPVGEDDRQRETKRADAVRPKNAQTPSVLWNRCRSVIRVRKEHVDCTMGQNVLHQLRSLTNSICDSYIITTEDGKVLVIDGGSRTETDYFIEYLRAATGQKTPHIDAWFLSHPHSDHCEVFFEILSRRVRAVTFDKVYQCFPPTDFYENKDRSADAVLRAYASLRDRFADKEITLHEGDVFSVGAARITVLYTYDPAFTNCNDSSVIFRMDLAGTSVLFTGDAAVAAGRKALKNHKDSGMLRCEYCKMAHHGQNGVERTFYEAVSPEVCLWPTPVWVWENRGGDLKTPEVRRWIEELGVRKNYIAKDGSQAIRLTPRIRDGAPE